jgi:hypothetical protein
LKDETESGKMIISTIHSLDNDRKDKLKPLERFEVSPKDSLTSRVAKEAEREKAIAATIDIINANYQHIDSSDDRITSLQFYDLAEKSFHHLTKSYQSWTLDQVINSTEYQDLIQLTDESTFSSFERLKDKEPFIKELVKQEASTCKQFLDNVNSAKSYLERDVQSLRIQRE